MSAKFPRGGGAGPFLARSLFKFDKGTSMLVEFYQDSSQKGQYNQIFKFDNVKSVLVEVNQDSSQKGQCN